MTNGSSEAMDKSEIHVLKQNMTNVQMQVRKLDSEEIIRSY